MTINKINSSIYSEQCKTIFWCLFGLIVIGIFSYGYFVRSAIVNIVERQEMEKQIANLSSKVLDLETEYVKAKSLVTEDTARLQGFVLADSQKFIEKSVKNMPGLSLNTH